MRKRKWITGIVATLASAAILLAAATDTRIVADTGAQQSAPAKDSPKVLLIRSKGKYGLIDRSGNLVLPPRYDSPIAFDSSYRSQSDNYFDIAHGESLRPAEINHKWGYIDKDGKEVIPPKYSKAGPFRDGWAQVQVGETWGIIDREGKWVIKPQYSFIGPFCDGVARVAVGGMRLEGGFPKSKWGFINKKDDQIVPVKYDYALSFSNGRALINIGGRWRGKSGLSFQEGRWGVIDESGKFVVEPKIEIPSGLPLHETGPAVEADLLPVKYDGKFGYRDPRWNFAIEPQFDEARPFSEELAVVKLEGKFGYINKTGQWAAKPRFQAAGDFSEGLAPVNTEKGVHFIDKHGTEILKINCDEARPFESGLAAVRVGRLWGIIDKGGRFLHKPQFTHIHPDDSDFLYIHNADGLRGLMNRQGKIVVPPKYGFIGGFQQNGFAMIDTESMGLPPEFWLIDREGQLIPGPMLPFDAANRHKSIAFFPKRLDEKWGIVNDAGEFVIAPRFTNVEMLAVGVLGVQDRQKWGMVDLENGKLIVEPTYYSISRFSEGLAATRPDPPNFPPAKGDWVGYIDLSGRLVIANKFASGGSFNMGIAQVGILYHGDMDLYYIDKEGRFLWHPDGN